MDGLREAYEAARAVTGHHARSFYFSSHLLPRRKRYHAYAIYACCRHIDDQIDEVRAGEDFPGRVGAMREWVSALYRDTAAAGCGDSRLPWVPAFQETVRECEVPEAYFQDLLTGVEMDRGRVRIQDDRELEKYCYHVAGVVGLMMTRVFGLEDRTFEAEAVKLGNAMQLTNILRDVAEDWRRDRIYLPATELEEFKITEAQIAGGVVDEAWAALMRFQIGRARDMYREAERGIVHLPDDGSRGTVWAMRDVYAGILEAVEDSGYRVFDRRCHVPFWGKCRLVVRGRWQRGRREGRT